CLTSARPWTGCDPDLFKTTSPGSHKECWPLSQNDTAASWGTARHEGSAPGEEWPIIPGTPSCTSLAPRPGPWRPSGRRPRGAEWTASPSNDPGFPLGLISQPANVPRQIDQKDVQDSHGERNEQEGDRGEGADDQGQHRRARGGAAGDDAHEQ